MAIPIAWVSEFLNLRFPPPPLSMLGRFGTSSVLIRELGQLQTPPTLKEGKGEGWSSQHMVAYKQMHSFPKVFLENH